MNRLIYQPSLTHFISLALVSYTQIFFTGTHEHRLRLDYYYPFSINVDIDLLFFSSFFNFSVPTSFFSFVLFDTKSIYIRIVESVRTKVWRWENTKGKKTRASNGPAVGFFLCPSTSSLLPSSISPPTLMQRHLCICSG